MIILISVLVLLVVVLVVLGIWQNSRLKDALKNLEASKAREGKRLESQQDEYLETFEDGSRGITLKQDPAYAKPVKKSRKGE